MRIKLARIALSRLFDDKEIDNALEVCMATNNPEVAIEKLLGAYEPPKLAITAKRHPYNSNRNHSNITLKSINEMEGNSSAVDFGYERPKRVRINYDSSVRTEQQARDEYKNSDPKDNYGVKTDDTNDSFYADSISETEASGGTCSIEEWIKACK